MKKFRFTDVRSSKYHTCFIKRKEISHSPIMDMTRARYNAHVRDFYSTRNNYNKCEYCIRDRLSRLCRKYIQAYLIFTRAILTLHSIRNSAINDTHCAAAKRMD